MIAHPNKSVYNESGKFLGINVKNPTDFEGGEEEFIKGEPYGFIKNGFTKTPFYGLRKIYYPSYRGTSIEQALINFLGSPAWINISFEN